MKNKDQPNQALNETNLIQAIDRLNISLGLRHAAASFRPVCSTKGQVLATYDQMVAADADLALAELDCAGGGGADGSPTVSPLSPFII